MLLEDAVEPREGLVLLALLVGEEAVDVEREVVLPEPRVVLEDAREQIARRLEVRLGDGSSLIDRLRLPGLEPIDELLALELPLQLAEPEHRLRHLARLARRLRDERGQETDRFSAKLTDLGDVTIDARLELLLELRAERVGDLRAVHRTAASSREGRGARSLLRTLRGAGLLCRLRVDRLLGGRAHGRTRRRRRHGGRGFLDDRLALVRRGVRELRREAERRHRKSETQARANEHRTP